MGTIIKAYKKVLSDMIMSNMVLEDNVFMNNLKTYLYIKNMDGNYLWCNKSFLDFLGYECMEQISDKTDYHFLSKNHADSIRKNELLTLENGYYYGEEVVCVQDENRILLSSKSKIIDSHNKKTIGIIVNSMDITNYKLNQQYQENIKLQDQAFEEQNKIRQIIDAVNASIYWTDLNGCIIDCNQYVLKMFGVQNRRDLIGKNAYDLINEEEANKFAKIDQEVLTKGSYYGEEFGTVADKTIKYYMTSKTRLTDGKGIPIGIVGTSIDITDYKLAQQQAERLSLENQAHKIEHEQQEKFRAIVEQVVHDIRSPLATMTMTLPHCDALPEQYRHVLNMAANRIRDISNNLLNQFKDKNVENNEPQRNPTLICNEILEIIAEKKFEYSKLPVEFVTKINQDAHFTFINVDSEAFKRMLSNIINNAVDAINHNQKVTITIFLNVVDTHRIQIIVEDNGKGMPYKVKEKILNKVPTSHDKENGHGIGYSQIHNTLKENDGTLEIESESGVGTKVILTFAETPKSKWFCKEIELVNDDTLIILDDEQSIHGAWELRLTKEAPHIRRKHFEQGSEAIEFINKLGHEEKEKIFLLTDYELLNQNGLTGLEVVRKTEIKRSVLVTSHHANANVINESKLTKTKILPKLLAAEVPIIISDKINSKIDVDIIIADDDSKFADTIAKHIFRTCKVDKFSDPKDLLKEISSYPEDVIILVTNHFQYYEIDGLVTLEQLHNKGFRKLYLFAGNDFDNEVKIPDYINVIAKNDIDSLEKIAKT